MRNVCGVGLCRLRRLTYAVCFSGGALTLLLAVSNINNDAWFKQNRVDVPEVASVFDINLYEAEFANATGLSYCPPHNETALRWALADGSIQCYKIGRLYSKSIPPIVHFTSKDGVAMERHVPLLRSWKQLLNATAAAGPFRFMHWSDKRLDKLIGTYYPTVYRVYRQLTNGLERSDIGRLVIIHHVGGVYADLDVELRRDFSPLLNNYSAVWSQEPLEHAIFLYNKPRLVSNALLMSQSGQAFLTYVLQRWPAWFQRNWAYKKRNSWQAVFSTGPIMLNDFYEQYLAEFGNEMASMSKPMVLAHPDLFQPIWDADYLPRRSRLSCWTPGYQTPLKRRICQKLAKRSFATKPVPPEAYTVHWFLHTSYSKQKDKRISIQQLLPLSHCKI